MAFTEGDTYNWLIQEIITQVQAETTLTDWQNCIDQGIGTRFYDSKDIEVQFFPCFFADLVDGENIQYWSGTGKNFRPTIPFEIGVVDQVYSRKARQGIRSVLRILEDIARRKADTHWTGADGTPLFMSVELKHGTTFPSWLGKDDQEIPLFGCVVRFDAQMQRRVEGA